MSKKNFPTIQNEKLQECISLNDNSERNSVITAPSVRDVESLMDAKPSYPMVDTKLLDQDGLPLDNAFEGNPIFASLSVRLNFIRKVYAILLIQLIATTATSVIACFVPEIKNFLNNNIILMLVLMLVLFFMSFVIYFGRGFFLRRAPYNYIFLLIFTSIMSYILAGLCANTNYKVVILALVMTLTVTFAITAYACISTSDLTIKGGIIVQVISILALALSVYFIGGSFGIKIIHILLCIFGAIFYGMFLLIDSMMLFSDEKWGFKVDDYVLAALTLYIDIVLIFIKMIECLSTIWKNNDVF